MRDLNYNFDTNVNLCEIDRGKIRNQWLLKKVMVFIHSSQWLFLGKI